VSVASKGGGGGLSNSIVVLDCPMLVAMWRKPNDKATILLQVLLSLLDDCKLRCL